MRSRAKDRLQELDDLYPPLAPWSAIPDGDRLSHAEKAHEGAEWIRVRRAMRHFLDTDGKRRMQKFEAYEIGAKQKERLEAFGQCLHERGGRALKSTSFIPAEVEYTLPLYLDCPIDETENIEDGSTPVLVLDNPTGMKDRKALSYIRYLLRSAGIGYHCLTPDESDETIYQLVLAFPTSSATISTIPTRPNANGGIPAAADIASPRTNGHGNGRAQSPRPGTGTGWVASLNPFKRPPATRSVSLPAQRRPPARSPSLEASTGKKGKETWLKIWIKIEFQSHPSGPHSSSDGSEPPTPTSALGRLYLSPIGGTQPLPDFNGLGMGMTYVPRRPSPRRVSVCQTITPFSPGFTGQTITHPISDFWNHKENKG